MPKINFEDDYVRINDEGIDCLRNKFVYKHVNFEDIHSVDLKRGHISRNWILALLLGLAFICIPILLYFNLFSNFNTINFDTQPLPSLRSLLTAYISLIFLIILGVIFVRQALLVSNVAKINMLNSKPLTISLRKFEKKGTITSLMDFLESKNIPVLKK